MSKIHLLKARALNVIVILSLALAGLTFSTPTIIADSGPEPLADPTAPSAVGHTPIVGSPLTINVARDGSYQVVHDGVSSSTPGQVYYTGWDEADSGIMLWYDGMAIGPDFGSHGGTATGYGGFDPWEMVDQGSVTGIGTDADPWEVETNLAYQGLVMTTTTSYSDTNDYFDIAWQICPPAPADLSTFLGADLYLQGSDKGYSYFQDRGAIAPGSALVVGGRNYYNNWYELFIELTQADHYHEGRWHDFWQRIGTNQQTPGSGFPDTVGSSTAYRDNAAGLQWDLEWASDPHPDGCYDVSARWSFAAVAVVPPSPPNVSMEKTVGLSPGVCAASNSVDVPSGTDVTYCYKIFNTGSVTITHHTLVDDKLGLLLDDHAYDVGPGESYSVFQTTTINDSVVNEATWTVTATTGLDDSFTNDASVTVLDAPTELPIIESFTGPIAPEFTFGGGAGLTAPVTDPPGSGWLELNGTGMLTGYLFYDNAFPSADGIAVRFQYASYGGDTNGLAFFLLDGITSNPTIGDFNGSFGYDGVPNGYVGLGLDEVGNFGSGTADSAGLLGSSVGGYNPLIHTELDEPPFNTTVDGVNRANARWVQITIVTPTMTAEIDFGSGYEEIFEYDLTGQTPPLPETLRFGYGASAQIGSPNTHQVRNLTIKKPSDMTMSVTDNQTTTVPGSPIEYIIVISNNPYNVVDGASVVANLPPSIIGVSWQCEASPATHSRCHVDSGMGNTIGTLIDLAPGDTVTLTVTGVVAQEPNTPLHTEFTVYPPIDITDVDETDNSYEDTTNLAPTTDSDTFIVDEDSVYNILDVIDNDGDVDGDPFTLTAVGTPDNGGTVAIVGTTIVYTPALGFVGTETFIYTVTDDQGGSNTGQVSIDVRDVNSAPMTDDDSATVIQDSFGTTIYVLGNDSDPDGDSLTVLSVGPASHGAVANQETHVIYVPTADYTGTDSFMYVATDGYLTDTATVEISVTVAPNSAPVINDDTAGVLEDGSVTVDVLANDTDPDGDTLAVEKFCLYISGICIRVSSTSTDHGSVSTDGSTIVYTPDPNYNGMDSFTYQASDGKVSVGPTAIVTVTVTAVNDAPITADDIVTPTEDTEIFVHVLDNDSDVEGSNLTVVDAGPAGHGTVEVDKDGLGVEYTPDPNYTGPDSFPYTASDGNLTNDGMVYVNVTAVNDPPQPNDDTVATAYNTRRLIHVLGNDIDPDGDTLTVVDVSLPPSRTTIIDGSTVMYTPTAGISSTIDVFAYTVNDGMVDATAWVWVEVSTRPNYPPTAVDDPVTVIEDTASPIAVLANDFDPYNDPITVKAVGDPLSGTVSTDGVVVVYTPTLNFFGTDTFTYTVTDGVKDATASVVVQVMNVNDSPVSTNDNAITVEETPVGIPVLANDSDPEDGKSGTLIFNILSVSALGFTPNGLLETDGTVITYTPELNFFGVDTFTYTVSDGSADGVDTSSVAVTVTNTNDPPFANWDLALVFMRDDVIVLPTIGDTFKSSPLANDDDPDCYFNWGLFQTVCDYGDELSIIRVGQSRYGTTELGPAGQVITYTPGPFFLLHGGEVLTYTVSDGLGGTDTDVIILLGYDYSVLLPMIFK